jgi:hypothetical protein
MSAFEDKADITFFESPLLRSLSGAKRTRPFALHMSASDPKRTSRPLDRVPWLISGSRHAVSRIQFHSSNRE